MTKIIAILSSILFCHSSLAHISYLRFEDVSGATASDETGLMDGELINFITTDAGGGDDPGMGWSVNTPNSIIPLTGESNNGSIRIRGGSTYIDLSNGNDLTLGDSFTIEMFIWPESVGVMFGFSPGSGLGMSLSESSGELYFNMSMNGATPFTAATGISTGEWSHVALIKESNSYQIYVDGTLIADEGVGGDNNYFFPGSTLGTRTIGGPTGTWNGYIDEFRISDEALLPSQFLIVPEPSSILLVSIGGALVALSRRRR